MIDPATQAPTRILDVAVLNSGLDSGLDAALRRDLELASNASPIAYDAAAGLARFEQALASQAGATSAATAGAGARVLGWLLGAAVLVGGGIGAAWMVGQDSGGQLLAHASVPVDVDVESASGDQAPSEGSTRVRAEDAPVVGSTSSDAGQRGDAPAGESVAEVSLETADAEGGTSVVDSDTPPRPSSESTPDASTSLADEAVHINAGRKALDGDPARTLALMQEAEQLFPDGAMIQERRGYAILALVALGRMDEAELEADAYLQRWPSGPLARRVREALGR